MIKSFKCKETEKIFNRQFSKKFPKDIQNRALMKLWMLDVAAAVSDLKTPPANRLEALIHDRQGQYSIRINERWRICFEWKNNNAFNVEIIDYH
jgi:proteic killer suppression protein